VQKQTKRKMKMKKLIIAAFAVAFAAATQAATINWGGDICLQDCTTPLTSGSTAYLVFSETAFAAPTTVTIADGGIANWTVNNGASVVASYSITDADIGNWNFVASYNKSGEAINGYFGVIVVDGSAAADGLSGAYASLVSANLEATAPTANLLYGDGSFNNWIGENGFNSVSFTAASVPEPTSGLLMLVGLAGLALRRRRA
jgi:hypothetical protein